MLRIIKSSSCSSKIIFHELLRIEKIRYYHFALRYLLCYGNGKGMHFYLQRQIHKKKQTTTKKQLTCNSVFFSSSVIAGRGMLSTNLSKFSTLLSDIRTLNSGISPLILSLNKAI